MNLSYKKGINIITMKIALYFSALAVLLGACSSSQNFTRAQEDDIYYVPGKRSLFAQEIKDKTGVDITSNTSSRSQISKNTNKDKVYPKEIDNSVNPKSHSIGMARYATEKQVQKEEARTGQTVNRVAVPADDGYWIGGFKGSENDLEECVRIMNRYPEGFAYFGNGYEIAQNLSFSSDWNVYTIDGRYWWFPSSSNVGLYSQLIFGNYPKYIWTVIWNDPRFDSFAWSNNVSFGWNRWGWANLHPEDLPPGPAPDLLRNCFLLFPLPSWLLFLSQNVSRHPLPLSVPDHLLSFLPVLPGGLPAKAQSHYPLLFQPWSQKEPVFSVPVGLFLQRNLYS